MRTIFNHDNVQCGWYWTMTVFNADDIEPWWRLRMLSSHRWVQFLALSNCRYEYNNKNDKHHHNNIHVRRTLSQSIWHALHEKGQRRWITRPSHYFAFVRIRKRLDHPQNSAKSTRTFSFFRFDFQLSEDVLRTYPEVRIWAIWKYSIFNTSAGKSVLICY